MRGGAAVRLVAARREAWSALFCWIEERRSAACAV
jgi:hypothetical protein